MYALKLIYFHEDFGDSVAISCYEDTVVVINSFHKGFSIGSFLKGTKDSCYKAVIVASFYFNYLDHRIAMDLHSFVKGSFG